MEDSTPTTTSKGPDLNTAEDRKSKRRLFRKQKREECPDPGSYAEFHSLSNKAGGVLSENIFESSRHITLPDYSTQGISERNPPLGLADCMKAVLQNFYKARLILFETARLNRPKYAVFRGDKRVKLTGDVQILDLTLFSFMKQPAEDLSFGPGEAFKGFTAINQKILKGEALISAQSTAKLTILRQDKEFRRLVIDTLKLAMIDNRDINHANFVTTTKEIQGKITSTVRLVQREWFNAAAKVASAEERVPLLELCPYDAEWACEYLSRETAVPSE